MTVLHEITEYLQLLNPATIALRLLLAGLCSGAVGLNRERKHQAAGLRTHMLVSLAACLVMMTGLELSTRYNGDATRLAAQVVSGIGFLGAGTIMVSSSRSTIRGLTTAASLWAVACVGLALGGGFYFGGILGSILMLFVVSRMSAIDKRISPETHHLHLYIEMEDISVLKQTILVCKSRGYRILSLETNRNKQGKEKTTSVLIDVEGTGSITDDLAEHLEKIPGVIFASALNAA